MNKITNFLTKTRNNFFTLKKRDFITNQSFQTLKKINKNYYVLNKSNKHSIIPQPLNLFKNNTNININHPMVNVNQVIIPTEILMDNLMIDNICNEPSMNGVTHNNHHQSQPIEILQAIPIELQNIQPLPYIPLPSVEPNLSELSLPELSPQPTIPDLSEFLTLPEMEREIQPMPQPQPIEEPNTLAYNKLKEYILENQYPTNNISEEIFKKHLIDIYNEINLFKNYELTHDNPIKFDDFTNTQKIVLNNYISHKNKKNKNRAIIGEEFIKSPNLKKDEAFFMIDIGDILRQHNQWLINCGKSVEPFYAIKCNNNPIIIKLLYLLGCGFDIASKEEYNLLKKLGIILPENKVIFSNPCKNKYHLNYSKKNNIKYCTFDNEYELEKILKYNKEIGCLLRIAVDDSYSVCQFNSKFGANINNGDVDKLLNLCKRKNINLRGIMFHVGSGCNNFMVYDDAIKKCSEIFNLAINKYKFDPTMFNMLDLGGGFPGVNDKKLIDFKDIARTVNSALNKYGFLDGSINKHGIRVIAEPGRYYVAKSHILCCDIILKKKKKIPAMTDNVDNNNNNNDTHYLYYINDGMYGSFNCMYYDHSYPTLIPYSSKKNENKEKDELLYKSTIFGPTCDSMDKMYSDYLFPEMTISDKIIVPNFGAYTVAAAADFNGFPVSKSFYYLTL